MSNQNLYQTAQPNYNISQFPPQQQQHIATPDYNIPPQQPHPQQQQYNLNYTQVQQHYQNNQNLVYDQHAQFPFQPPIQNTHNQIPPVQKEDDTKKEKELGELKEKISELNKEISELKQTKDEQMKSFQEYRKKECEEMNRKIKEYIDKEKTKIKKFYSEKQQNNQNNQFYEKKIKQLELQLLAQKEEMENQRKMSLCDISQQNEMLMKMKQKNFSAQISEMQRFHKQEQKKKEQQNLETEIRFRNQIANMQKRIQSQKDEYECKIAAFVESLQSNGIQIPKVEKKGEGGQRAVGLIDTDEEVYEVEECVEKFMGEFGVKLNQINSQCRFQIKVQEMLNILYGVGEKMYQNEEYQRFLRAVCKLYVNEIKQIYNFSLINGIEMEYKNKGLSFQEIDCLGREQSDRYFFQDFELQIQNQVQQQQYEQQQQKMESSSSQQLQQQQMQQQEQRGQGIQQRSIENIKEEFVQEQFSSENMNNMNNTNSSNNTNHNGDVIQKKIKYN